MELKPLKDNGNVIVKANKPTKYYNPILEGYMINNINLSIVNLETMNKIEFKDIKELRSLKRLIEDYIDAYEELK